MPVFQTNRRDVGFRRPFLRSARSRIRRSPSGNGSGCSSTASMAENTAVLAPMPSASVSTTVAVKPGVRASVRTA